MIEHTFPDVMADLAWFICKKNKPKRILKLDFLDHLVNDLFTDLSEEKLLKLLFVLLGSHVNEVLIKGRA